MNQGKFVFLQIVEFFHQRVFDGIVEKYNGNKYVKHFTCWNQLLCMVFGQLTNRDSLRDLLVAINVMPIAVNPIILVLGKMSLSAIWQRQT